MSWVIGEGVEPRRRRPGDRGYGGECGTALASPCTMAIELRGLSLLLAKFFGVIDLGRLHFWVTWFIALHQSIDCANRLLRMVDDSD